MNSSYVYRSMYSLGCVYFKINADKNSLSKYRKCKIAPKNVPETDVH